MATSSKGEVKYTQSGSGRQVGTGTGFTEKYNVSQRLFRIQNPATTTSQNENSGAGGFISRQTNKLQTGRKEAWPSVRVESVPTDSVDRGSDKGTKAMASTKVEEALRTTEDSFMAAISKLLKENNSAVIEIYKNKEEPAERPATPNEQPPSPGRLSANYYIQAMDLKRKNATLEDDLTKQSEAAEQLRSENQELQQEKVELLKKTSACEKEFRRQKAALLREIKPVMEEKVTLEKRLVEAESQIKQKEEENQNFFEELKSLRTKLQEVEKSSADGSRQILAQKFVSESSTLELQLKREKENVKELRRKVEELSQENETMATKQASFEKQQQAQTTEFEQYKEQVTAERLRLEKELENADMQIKQMEEENQKLVSDVKSLTTEMREQETKSQLSNRKLAEKYYKEYLRMKDNNATLDLDLQTQKETVEKLLQQNTNILQEQETLKMKHASSEMEQQKLKERFDTYSKQLLEEKSVLEQTTHDLKIQLRHKEIECRDSKKDLISLKAKAEKEEEAKKDALSRLSRQMGEKMTEGNAAIADLSDKDRPTKLAERYNELYDNVWTDSLAFLTDDRHETETTAVEILLNILMDCFHYCSNTVEKQTSDLYMNVLFNENVDEDALPSDLKTLVKDVKKAGGNLAYKNVFQTFKRKLESGTSSRARSALHVEDYVKECFEVCWQMCLRDPPLVLAPLPKSGDRLESELYKEYTKSGSEVDYVVWPALLLHKDGPLLGKGVVQPKQDIGQRSKSGRGRTYGLHKEHSSSTSTDNSEQNTTSRSPHSTHSYLPRTRMVPEVADTTKMKNYTEYSVGTYQFEQSNPTSAKGGADLKLSPGNKIARNQPVTREIHAASSLHTRPRITEAEVNNFVLSYNTYGYRWCQSAFGEKLCGRYYSVAKNMRLL